MGTKHTLLAGALLAAALCLFAPAVGAADTPVGNLETDGYTVTIPSTVAFAEGDKTQKLEITGALGKYRTLDVTVASKNDYALKYASDPANNALPSLSYTLKSADTDQKFDSETTGKNTLSYTTDATESNPIRTTLNAEITTPLDTATMSGSYTDNLTFTFDCKKRTQECNITVKYESMDTTATGEITKRERNSQWENETHTFKETLNLGEEHTFELEDLFKPNSNVKYAVKSKDDTENKNAWEFGEKAMLDPTTHQYTTRTYSITPTPEEANYEIKVYRKLVWLDLNYIIYDSVDQTNPLKYENIKYGAEYGAKNIAMMEITVNTETKNDKRDYWGMHPYGSTFTMSNIRNGNVEDFKNYAIYGYYLGHLSTDLTNSSDVHVFAESEAKTTGSQTLKDVYCSTSNEYGGDYSEAVYVILRPYTVTIKYETWDSKKDVSSNTEHKRHSVFDDENTKVESGIDFSGDTYTWENDKYKEDSNAWKDAEYTITKVSGRYDYTIEVLRTMYALDLNVALRTRNSSGGHDYTSFGSKYETVSKWGTADIIVNDKKVGNGLYDYFTAHPYSSSFSVANIKTKSNYRLVGYKLNGLDDTKYDLYTGAIEKVLDDNTAEEARDTMAGVGETEVINRAVVWLIVEDATTTANDLIISDEETITPPTPSKTPTTDDTIASDTDDVTDDDPAADTSDTPTPSDDDDVAPGDADDTTDTPSDADDTDDADAGTDDTEPADDPTDDPDADDGDVEDTDAAGDDVLDDEPDDVDGNADAENAPEPLDILA